MPVDCRNRYFTPKAYHDNQIMMIANAIICHPFQLGSENFMLKPRPNTLILICGILFLLGQHASSFTIKTQQIAFSNRYYVLKMSDPEREESNGIPRKEPENEESRDLLRRFTAPVIDDAGLPITDALMAQIVAPSLQVFWITLAHSPSPTWLHSVFQSKIWAAQGSLLVPTLMHGAGLACCWITGALAAEAYKRKAIDPTVEGYGTVILTLLKAGAFASGLLILATQLDLLIEFGRWVQPGESAQIDLRLFSAIIEILNDIVFEAVTITIMRLSLAVVTAQRSKS